MKIYNFIKNHPNLIFLAIVQGVALFGLICGFAALFMSIMAGENAIAWLLCLGLPLLAFVLWVWCKAIIPWSLKIIDYEEKQNKEK